MTAKGKAILRASKVRRQPVQFLRATASHASGLCADFHLSSGVVLGERGDQSRLGGRYL